MNEVIPKNLCRASIGAVCSKPQYGWTTPANKDSGEVKLLRTTDITGGNLDWNSVPFCSESPEDLAKYQLATNDIVISRAGSVGASFLLKDVPEKAVFASYLIRFQPLKEIDPSYVAYFLHTSTYWSSIVDKSVGIAVPNVNATKLEEIEMPIAPEGEQKRIVSKLEELFSDLDAGVAALERARANLKRYRAAVLKAAVEGRLTAAWRQLHPKAEPASKLLARILAERRKKWEASQLARFVAAGKAPPKDWKDKYPEPAQPDTANLPELPEGWCWALVDQLCEVGTGTTPSRGNQRYWSNGTVPWVTSTVVNQPFVTEVRESVAECALEETTLRIYPKHTLILALYGEGKTRGKVSELLIDATINQALAALQTTGASAECRCYLKTFLHSNYESLRRNSAGGVQPNLNLGLVQRIAVPLPPLPEQIAIVSEVEAAASTMEASENSVGSGILRASRLRQSILKRAFEGKLLPQDPNDEPASALLARIRAARAKDAAAPRASASRKGRRRVA